MSKKFYKSRVIIFSIILLILIGFAFIQNKNLITDQTVNNPLFLQYKGDIYIDKKDKSLNLPFVFIDSNPNEKIFLSTILFLEKSGRKVIVHTYTGEYVSNRNISDWYDELGEKNFVIPYKGIIVNMGNIKRIEKNILILKNEHEIPISRNYVKSIKENFKEYIIEESRKI